MMAQRLFGGAAVPEVFANQVRMAVTLTDFTLVFGTAVPDQGGVKVGTGLAMISDKLALHVAPGTLKQMLLHSQMALDAYEAVMGPIKIPDKLPAFLAKHKALLIEMLRKQIEGTMDAEETPSNMP
jgi:hypothetical protein